MLVNKDARNLSRRTLPASKTSLLSEDVKFVSIVNKIDREKLRRELNLSAEKRFRCFCSIFRKMSSLPTTGECRQKPHFDLWSRDVITETCIY